MVQHHLFYSIFSNIPWSATEADLSEVPLAVSFLSLLNRAKSFTSKVAPSNEAEIRPLLNHQQSSKRSVNLECPGENLQRAWENTRRSALNFVTCAVLLIAQAVISPHPANNINQHPPTDIYCQGLKVTMWCSHKKGLAFDLIFSFVQFVRLDLSWRICDGGLGTGNSEFCKGPVFIISYASYLTSFS